MALGPADPLGILADEAQVDHRVESTGGGPGILRGVPASGTRLGTRRRLLALAGALVLGPFAVVLALVRLEWSPLRSLDRRVSADLHDFALDHAGWVDAMQLVSDVGGGAASWALLTPTVIYLLVVRRWRHAAFVAVTGYGGSWLNSTTKVIVDRERPEWLDPVSTAAGLSFPSGHASSSFLWCALLLVIFLPLVPARVRPFVVVDAALVVLLVGFSRIALGVHYVTDVVGGWLLAAAWLAVMLAVFDVRRGPVGETGPDGSDEGDDRHAQ